MAQVKAIENLVAARTFLAKSLEKSRAMASDLDKTGERLEQIRQGLPFLEAAIAPNNKILLQKCTFSAIKVQVDRAVFPAMAVLKVCKAIQELERSLISDNPHRDLSGYLLLIKQFKQASRFLRDNCGLAIQWLEGILQFLEENMVANNLFVFKVKMSLSILQDLQTSEERACLSGGILWVAFNKLKDEFKQLIEENCNPLAFPSFNEKQACIFLAPPTFPGSIVKKLQVIACQLNDNNRLDWCLSGYVKVRIINTRRSLEALDLSYLGREVTELDDVQDIEGFINQWCEHLELMVKDVLEVEYQLCSEVFDKFESNISMSCFGKIASQSGLVCFLQFGAKVTECKKDPVKLLKLLDMFSCLENLRTDFNRLFAGEECQEIQNLTRNLIKKVVCGACEIFWELPFQVENQRQSCPPLDGSIPRLVSFVTAYCNHLLSNDYKALLIKVLSIYQSWKNDKYEEKLLKNQIHYIIKEIGLNLDTWSQKYEDNDALSYIFMMNNHSHFCNLKGTAVGEMMGDAWIKGHKQYEEYYMTLYLKETWGKVISLLSQDRQLKVFNEALDGMYENQSKWVVSDENLRLKMCRVAIQAYVPLYRSYLQKYGDEEEEDVKYTVQGLETMLSSLFHPMIRMYGAASKQTHYLIEEVKNIDIHHFHHFTLMTI